MSRTFPTALVVDDSETCCLTSAALLERFGFLVATANNGLEAVRASRNTHFDVILMDCDMPLMDGLQATLTIRQIERDSRTLIVGVTSKANREKCLSVGMDDHISKPLTLDLLVSCLLRWGWTEINSETRQPGASSTA